VDSGSQSTSGGARRSSFSAADSVATVAVAAICAAAPQDVIGPVLDALGQVMTADAAGFYEHQREGWSVPLVLSPASVWGLVPFLRVPTPAIRTLPPRR
jgi:hypothetical protein